MGHVARGNRDIVMSCLFLSDFYNDQINGGAENNDAVLIHYLRSRNVAVDCKSTPNATMEMLDTYDCIILSNFVFLDDALKLHMLTHDRYIIYEHDHKYLTTRDPSKFVNFKAPETAIINRDLYANATEVIVLSAICKKVLEDNLQLTNVHSIGTSLWSTEKFTFLKHLAQHAKKTKELAVLRSNNPTKGMAPALQFCEENDVQADLISSPDQYEFLTILSEYKTLLFIPQVLETFCRLVTEAKMLNCQVQTKKNLIGFMSEPYSDQSGPELISTLEEKVEAALEHFYGLVTQ